MDGTNSRPRSTQLIVHWRINSSKHWAYNSLRTWQIPVSRACLCSNFWSSCSCKLITSKRVAGVEETLCRHNWPCSSHSRGGKIESRISSVSLRALASDSESPSESFSPFFFLPVWSKLVWLCGFFPVLQKVKARKNLKRTLISMYLCNIFLTLWEALIPGFPKSRAFLIPRRHHNKIHTVAAHLRAALS